MDCIRGVKRGGLLITRIIVCTMVLSIEGIYFSSNPAICSPYTSLQVDQNHKSRGSTPGSGDKEEKRIALLLHHTSLAWELLDACLTIPLRFLYARGLYA